MSFEGHSNRVRIYLLDLSHESARQMLRPILQSQMIGINEIWSQYMDGLTRDNIDQVRARIEPFAQDILGIETISPKVVSKEFALLLVDAVEILIYEQLVQLSQLDRAPDSTKTYALYATVNNHPYGIAFIAHDPNTPNVVNIQSITKFAAPLVLAEFYPDNSAYLPSLNSLLMPEIEQLAMDLGANEIQIVPLEQQERILRKHYGFVDGEDIIDDFGMFREAYWLVKYL